MKNLINALQKGNLKPKERVLLLVHNAVKKETTGKEILTEAEKHAISDGWQPANNEQVREYNRYNQGWKLAGFAELDAQTVFLDAQITYFQEKQANWHLVTYPIFRDAKRSLERLKDLKAVTITQAQEIVAKQRAVLLGEGEDFNRAVYKLAFESLNPSIREDILTLYSEANVETDYLDNEEEMATLLEGKDSLTDKEKELLAERIAQKAYNKHVKEWQFWHYYGSIPLKKVAERWITKRGIKPEELMRNEEADTVRRLMAESHNKTTNGDKIDPEAFINGFVAENLNELLEGYAKDHKTTAEEELKAVVVEWLNDGLLWEYQPLYSSTDTNAYNGTTKHPHNEVFKAWIQAKTKARETLTSLIKEGKLKREGDTITGESLYSFTGDIKFIREFKEWVDEYHANLGVVYADDDPEHKGEHLDRELLITDINKDGKPYKINFSQINLSRAEWAIDALTMVKETEVNGERVISFVEEEGVSVFGDLMKNTTKALVENYATLLSFQEIFKRLSKTYDIDLTYKINKWIKHAEDYIDYHNFTLKQATKQDFSEFKKHQTVRFKEDLYLDPKTIKPDNTRTGAYFKEITEALGEDF